VRSCKGFLRAGNFVPVPTGDNMMRGLGRKNPAQFPPVTVEGGLVTQHPSGSGGPSLKMFQDEISSALRPELLKQVRDVEFNRPF
jgi:hypothetical protein